MPLEKRNLINAQESDAETLLENDKSKDLKLIDEQELKNDEERNNDRAAPPKSPVDEAPIGFSPNR